MVLQTKSRTAFTLIELLLVIGIIGILASVVIQALNPGDIFRSTRDAERRADLNAIRKAVEQFQINQSRLPLHLGFDSITSTPTEICALDNSSPILNSCSILGFATLSELTPDYIAAIPIDPTYDPLDFPGDFRAPFRTHYFIWIDDQQRIFVRSSDFNNGEELTSPST